MKRLLPFLLVFGAIAPPASAVDATAPAPCNGYHLEDEAGDQMMKMGGVFGIQGQPQKGPDNSDIQKVFFNYRAGKDGKKVLTANIQVAKLDKTVPPRQYSSGGIAWYVFYSYKGETRFVRAHNQTGSGVTYGVGTVDPDTGVYFTDEDTQGAFFEGPNGIIQIDVPESAGGKPGETLGGTLGSADGFTGGPDDQSGFNNTIDQTPNDGNSLELTGPEYVVTECPAAAPASSPGAPAASPAPFSSPPPAPAPPGDAGSPPPASDQRAASGAPLLSFSRSFKAAKRGKRVRVVVKASKPVTSLTVQLRDARSKVVARGGLKKLSGTGRIFFKLRRALKPGRYTIVANAKVDGASQRVTQAVAVRK